MDFSAALIAYGEPAEAVQPGETAFNDPAMLSEFFRAFNAPARNAWRYPPSAASVSTAGIVVAFIGMAFFRPALRTARLAADCRYRVEHVFNHSTVNGIGAGESHGERNTVPVGHEMPLCAQLAAIRGT